MSQNGVTEVGKYRVVEQIGEGAMGVVYRAMDPILNRTVAIKVMSDALARDDDLRGRFLREAQAAGSLQHPNVITIYDFGEVDGHLFIAMEFVAGQDLEELLRKNIALTIVQKIDLLVDVLSGLGYAHRRGVVHRDIKPANIRIDEEGRARIMDFGIAHLQSSTLTKTGLMVGTPAYMAPEQVTGGTIGPGTDIFSVGAVMYELLTGKKPFEGESLQSVFYKIVSQPPPDLTTFTPSLPSALNSIALRALAKDPAERFPSAVEMANALTEARSSLDRVSSQPKGVSLRSAIDTGLSMRPTKPVPIRRSRLPMVLAGAAGIVLVIAGIGIVVTLSRRDHKVPTVQRPEPPTVAAATPTQPAPTPIAPPVVIPSATVQAGGTSSSKPAERTTPKTVAKPDAPTAQELALFRSLQSSALDSRRHATDAGATPEQLRAGDDHNTAASTAVQQGRVTEAASHLTLASTAWASAERDARAAAAAPAAATASSKTRAAVSEPPKQEVVAPPPSPVVVAQPAPIPAPARAAASNPAADIATVVSVYEKAIESRDMNEVRRAYPGITAVQASQWEQFFRSIRSINVTLTIGNLDVRGDAADARLTGAYDFVNSGGKSEHQPANFQATFRHDGGAWKLMSVR